MARESGIETEETPRPPLLEPEVLARPKDVELDPLVREQGLPEKEDGRFMDRWPLDRARELGETVVRRDGLKRLQEGTDEFGEWRALRHEVSRHRDGTGDEVTIATSAATAEREKRRAEKLENRAVVEEDVADGFAAEAKEAEDERLALPAALRGSRADIWLWAVAKFVLFAVDILVLHQALRLTIGTDFEHWLTAGMIGAGVVVLGDIVGWAVAAGTVRQKGSFRPPAERVAIATALIALLAVWFFVALGAFRADALSKLAELEEVTTASTGFFTLAQILFFVGAAACCFSFTARSDGRSLRRRQGQAEGKEKDYRQKSTRMRDLAEEADRASSDAPISCQAAEARRASREAVAQAQAELDRQQAKYLKPLLESEYLNRRAEVEAGLRFWSIEEGRQLIVRGRQQLSRLLHPALLLAAVVAAAAFIATHSGVIAGTAGLSVLLAIYVGIFVSAKPDQPQAPSDDEPPLEGFTAVVRETPLPPDSKRATEIELMVPQAAGSGRNGSGPEPGAGRESDPDA